MLRHCVMAIAATFLTAAVVSAQQAGPAGATSGDAERGRRLFMDHACYYCHGTVGHGGLAAVGPRIALVPRSLESFIAYVRRPAARMSAYSEPVVSDAALADIYAYLRSLPPAKPAREIPMLDQLRKPGGR